MFGIIFLACGHFRTLQYEEKLKTLNACDRIITNKENKPYLPIGLDWNESVPNRSLGDFKVRIYYL